MRKIEVGNRMIGTDHPCFIVAEIGLNHNGDMALAKRTIDAAIDAGVDSVKFQNYRTEDFICDTRLTHTYENYGKKVIESQYDMFKRCELDYKKLSELKTHCDQKGVDFHSTPTGMDGLADLLAMGVAILKNGSDYLGHLPLIEAMGNSGLPTVLSTGMATRKEIEVAVEFFRKTGNAQLILLHCVSLYPAAPEDVNLRRMISLAREFDCLVGFSDHTFGNEAVIGAVALGACWIEKHFTLDKELPGPDHRFSADPAEMKDLVRAVRIIEKQIGSEEIDFSMAENEARGQFRLSCVASRDLPSGWILKEKDIVFRRPGNGIAPRMVSTLYGRQLNCNVSAGSVLGEGNLRLKEDDCS
ncbi:MAG: N-acetylneuraminate synthase family protein [Proteobacteria bacterium]|nr:N-acetylneuraminate synthase family protein [Pseudomonadota bacterium]